jgi:signal transduction histidine kinase
VTRRIVLAVVGLITVLLAVLAVPLGLLTAAQDRADFADQTADTAVNLASVAEERIGDGDQATGLARSVRELSSRGDQVAVYDRAGRLIAGSTGLLSAGQVRVATSARVPHSQGAGNRLLVTAPVRADAGGPPIGTVALARPTAPLDHRVAVLWTLIGAVSAGGLVAAALVAVGLARWAGRPLTVLAAATRDLGSGALETRAQISTGPPEVRRLAGTFNAMAGRLQSLVHGHRSMMAEVSHQIRTPLAALRLRLDLLAEDCDEPARAELTAALDEVTRLSRLVNGMLAVARAENVTDTGERIEVGQVIRDRVAAWRPAAEEHGVTLNAARTGAVSAQAGAGQLEQILDNLLANALDVLPAGGIIEVQAVVADSMAQITVTDNGPGMTGEQKRSAFHRFASSTPGGTGLGLAIVDRLAVSNGGSATLSDRPGGGLIVTVKLPQPPDLARFPQARGHATGASRQP